MKRLLFLSATLLATVVSLACGPFDRCYRPENYITLRMFGNEMTGVSYEEPYLPSDQDKTDNLLLWASQTNRSIPLDDIEKVVYKWKIEQVQSLRNKILTHGKGQQSNAFAQWIVVHQDTDLVDFLLLAKRVEQVRATYNTKWYYPVEGDDFETTLQQLLTQTRSYTATRFRSRYALQQVRILYALCNYEECFNFWLSNKRFFSNDAIGRMGKDYVAGAAMRCGIKETAPIVKELLPYWPLSVSARSLKSLQQRLQICPHDPQILHYLQENINRNERYADRWYATSKNDYQPYYDFVKEAIGHHPITDHARWYYLLAFLAEQVNATDEAFAAIQKAQQYPANADLQASIRVLNIIFKTKHAKHYDQNLENWLYPQLQWLDRQITHHLTPSIRKNLMDWGFANHNEGISQYYWSDMMRRILIAHVAPLCLRSNYTTRALQYINYADYRIFQVLDTINIPFQDLSNYDPMTDRYDSSQDHYIPWQTYLRDYNGYSYYNDYFVTIDSMHPRYIERLISRMEHPACPLDRFLRNHGYASTEYLHEIAGTKYNLLGQYAKAALHLSKVPERALRCSSYLQTDPFTGKPSKTPPNKFQFAREMHRLQRMTHRAKDPNDRAEAMLRYARGMLSSIDHTDFAYTSYYYGSFDAYPFFSTFIMKHTDALIEQAENYKQQAFALFTDDERAAKACADWCMFKTAATHYPNTVAAKNIRTHCDHLADYTIQAHLAPGYYYHHPDYLHNR